MTSAFNNKVFPPIVSVMFNKSKRFMEFLKNKFGQDEIDKAMDGQPNEIKFMALYYPNVNSYNGREYLQLIIESFY